ncbi:MAG: type II secretion system protein [Thermoanaerobaculia bacterium]
MNQSRKQSGYTLVAVVIGMAVLAILIAAVAPSVAVIMKRDREQELIFRGKQYARGIGFFLRRYGRYPTDLKELYENRPRTIRKPWKDPMCDCKDWYLIIQGTPDAVPIGSGGPRGPAPPGGLGPPITPRPTPTPGVFGSPTETKNVGPIVGVRSRVHKEALQEWRGQKFYDEWRFIVGDADRQTGPFAPNPLKLP